MWWRWLGGQIPAVGAGSSPLILPIAPSAYLGTKRLSTYTGPCFVNTNDVDVNFDGNILANPASTKCKRWYDQSGNGHVFDNATSANQPSVSTTTKFRGITPISFDGRVLAPAVGKWLALPATLSLERTGYSFFMVCFPRVSLDTHCYMEFNNGGATVYSNIVTSSPFTGLTCQGAAASGSNTSSGVRPRANPQIFGYTSSAAAQKFFQHGAMTTGVGPKNTQTMNAGGWLGRGQSASSYGRFDCWAAIWYDTTLSDADANAVIDALVAAFNIPTTFTKRIVLDGDSITQGESGTDTLNQDSWAQAGLFADYECYNLGIIGQTLATCATNYATRAQLLYSAGLHSVLLIEGGTNDLNAGTAATDLYTTATSYVSSGDGTGFQVLLASILPRTVFTGAKLTEWNAYNPLVRTNSAAADMIVDYQSDATIGPAAAASDTNLYVDGTHPTPLGYSYRAAIQRAALLVA